MGNLNRAPRMRKNGKKKRKTGSLARSAVGTVLVYLESGAKKSRDRKDGKKNEGKKTGAIFGESRSEERSDGGRSGWEREGEKYSWHIGPHPSRSLHSFHFPREDRSRELAPRDRVVVTSRCLLHGIGRHKHFLVIVPDTHRRRRRSPLATCGNRTHRRASPSVASASPS